MKCNVYMCPKLYLKVVEFLLVWDSARGRTVVNLLIKQRDNFMSC